MAEKHQHDRKTVKDRHMDEQTNGRTNGQMDGHTLLQIRFVATKNLKRECHFLAQLQLFNLGKKTRRGCHSRSIITSKKRPGWSGFVTNSKPDQT